MTTAWTLEHARRAHHAARQDLAQRVSSEMAVSLATRRVRAAFMADNGWTHREIAQALRTPIKTVRRDLSYVRQLDVCTEACASRIRPRDRVRPPLGPRVRSPA
jgi:DNA-directed RNA polymerase specialized sigma24 family protein